MTSPNEPQSAVPERMVIVTIVVADLLRKTETNGAGILKGAGRSVRSMTRRPVGHCLPRSLQKRNYQKGLKFLTLLPVQEAIQIDKRRSRWLHRLVEIDGNHNLEGRQQALVEPFLWPHKILH